jgi:glycosyltransferase involved in cell wall biosynthesis
MKDLLVSIIIITRNRPFLLRHCLDRVVSQPYPHKEIIVVDSSSNDESEQVVAGYSEVVSVRLPYSGPNNNRPQARNEGIAAASGDILAFIDDDSMVRQGWIEALVNAYRDQTVGAVGGRVINMPEPYCDQVSGPPQLVVLPWGRVIMKNLSLLSTDPIEVDHLQGCNMSFHRKALEQVGGFDSNYILVNFRDETDLCVRVKRAGWRIVFSPEMAVVHFPLRLIHDPYFQHKPVYQFSNGCNSMYFAVKHFGVGPRTLFSEFVVDGGKPWIYVGYLPVLLIASAMAHSAGRIVGLLQGIAWHINGRLRVTSAPKLGGDNRQLLSKH